MDLQKINVKFFAADARGVRLEEFIGVFNSWIQASDGAYYDIADYSHVPAGPGIVLVAHEANVSIDCGGNRMGLLYNRKQPLAGTNQDKLKAAFKAALEYCLKLEREPALGGKLKFLGNEALLIVNDRLLAPNSEETFRAVKPEMESFARALYRGAEFSFERDPDPRKRFNLSVRTPAATSVEALLESLSEAQGERAT
ncbi:MAG TPA: hypothetical protein VNL14_17635 [Candidatus Acidoferrales bacterium]|nr:hypothetical protein [Candidatus Acidoferrales bacterium]